MRLKKLFNARTLTVLLALMVVAVLIYAFAAANVVPESGAGIGSGTISGYTISGISYNLTAGDPSTVDSVELVVTATAGAGAPTSVQARVTGSAWTACTDQGASWLCSFTAPVSTSALVTLEVAAAQ